ncbi:MAG: hypothetical protein WBV82_03255 [Myxococcaceae bacterium]
MAAFDGRWKVRRESGLLLPFGIRKFISGDHGWTQLGPIPVAPFRVEGTRLTYRGWPIRDELQQAEDGVWHGTGYLFGRRFCTFRLDPLPRRLPGERLRLGEMQSA